MKKIIALLLCAALLLPMALNTGAVYAAETPAIVCEDVTCSHGEQVTVEVTVANNPGFAYLELTPQYASELSLAKVQNGDLVSDFTKGKQYVWVADEDVTDDGLLLTFTFDVADTVPAGEYSVDFILRACYNYDEESVQFTVQSGTVKVEQAAPAVPAGITYEITDGEVTITGFTEELNGGLEIPETIEGYPVTAIGDEAFWCCRQMTAVTIPDSVRSIGSTAFAQCSWLTSLTLGAGVTSIGGHAFYMCSRLAEVVIPASVTEIGEYAFGGESHEEMSIVFEGNMPTIAETAFCTTQSVPYSCYYPADNSTWNADALQNYGDEVTWKRAYTVASGENQEIIHSTEKDFILRIDGGIAGLQGISIDGVEIDPTCYTVNENLGLVTVSAEYIKTIPGDHGVALPLEERAVEVQATFVNTCGENLTWELDGEGTLTISGTGPMTDYGDVDAPWYSVREAVKKVVIENGATRIGDYAFFSCALTEVVFPETLESVGDCAFLGCEKLGKVAIPDGVTVIETDVFGGCNGLKTAVIADSVTEIGSYLFTGCSSLEVIVLSNGISEIPNDVFSGCSSLMTVDIPNGVRHIGMAAFSDCENLTSVTLPERLESIAEDAFSNCTKLEAISIPDSVMNIGWGAFRDCDSLTTITIPGNVENICGETFTDCSGLSAVIFEEGLRSIGFAAFGGCNGLTTITMPNSMVQIGSYAFQDCAGLTSVDMGDNVSEIGMSAFANCVKLNAVEIPDSVASIDQTAFSGCSGLTSAKIGSGVTEVGSFIFEGCSNLEEVVLSEGIPKIPEGMFEYCSSLTSVVIPDSVTSIGTWAFDCCSNLQTVIFSGNAPQINSEAFSRVTATCYYPADNATWTADVMQNYGGNITWLPAGEIVVEKEDGTTDSYVSLQAAVDAFGGTDKEIVLQSSVTEDITVDQSVVLDLNGCTLTGSVSGSGTLTVKDSKTDDFDVEDGEGYGVITGTAGNVVPAEGYVKIVENGETSIHKVDLTIKNMTLRPEEAGLYFKSDFAGDQVVARNVDSFGVALSVTGEPDETTLQNPLHFTRYEKEAFGTGADNTSTLLTGILKETNGYNTNQRNAKIKVYGRAYIEVDGVVTFGACQNRSMREQLEGIDGKWSQLDDAQKSGILAMYDTYKMVMRGWELPNIKANLS